MNRIRRITYCSLAILFALAIWVGAAITAFADDGTSLDINQSGSVTLKLVGTDGNAVSGGTITIYEVASLSLEDGNAAYDNTGDFQSFTAALDVDDTSLAEALAEYVNENEISGSDVSVGTDGTVTFNGLELGFYLLVQTTESAHYETISPFVVTVPMESDGIWVYDVDASPKVGAVTAIDPENPSNSSVDPSEPSEEDPSSSSVDPSSPSEDNSADPTEETSGDSSTSGESGTTGSTSGITGTVGGGTLPQTGQLNWPIPLLAACGLALFLLGCVMNRSGNRKKGKRCRTGSFCITPGVFLMVAALGLLTYNRWDNWRAGQTVADVQDALEEAEESEETQELDYSGVFAVQTDFSDEDAVPEEMDTIIIDGCAYIGTLSIPSYGLELPIMSEWSYEGMKNAPGRYAGSVWTDDLVICGHNYSRHLGNLQYLEPGDAVSFTDVNGNVFDYEVLEVTILQPTDVEEMVDQESSAWDLTLFTCTLGGQARVTVRCGRTDGE
ncbi:MAG: sortase [Clostridiales bacterium]|nr:sortase [Clostridiales bacterium]